MEVLANMIREFRGEAFHCEACEAEMVIADSEAALTMYATYGGYPRVPLRRRATAAMGWAFLKKDIVRDKIGRPVVDKFGNEQTREVWACGGCFDVLLFAPVEQVSLYASPEQIQQAATNRLRHSQPEVVT